MRWYAGLIIAAVIASTSPLAAADTAGLGLRTTFAPDAGSDSAATTAIVQTSPRSRLMFSAAVEPDGWIDRSDDGATAFTAKLRAGYQATPSLMPFVEMEVFHPPAAAWSGGGQTQPQYAWRAGVAFDHGVSGELAAGYVAALSGEGAAGGLAIDGSLAWAATPLTTVAVKAATALASADDPVLLPGSVVYDGSVGLTFAWTGDLDLTGVAGFRHARAPGAAASDTRYRAGFGARWAADGAEMSAGYQHEWRGHGDAGGGDSDAVRVELTVRR